MDFADIEEVAKDLTTQWGYRSENKYSDECWKIQFAGPSVCEHCDHQYDVDKCTGIFIRYTMHNEKGFMVPFRRQKFPQSMLPGIFEWLKERQKDKAEAIAYYLIVDEGVRRSRLIKNESIDAVFECQHCKKEFWFESVFITYTYDRPDNEDGEEAHFCSDNCRMYHEEEYQYCDSCSKHIYHEHFIYNENIGDTVCTLCVKKEFLEDDLLSNFIDNDKIPPHFSLVVPDGFKHIKVFDEFGIDGGPSLNSFCEIMRNLQKRGKILILRPDESTSDEKGEVEVFIKPFSKNKLRKARKYSKAI